MDKIDIQFTQQDLKNKKKKKRNHQRLDYKDEIEAEIEIYHSNHSNRDDRNYEVHYQYLSQRDRNEFDSKFSRPKNTAQEKYMSYLQNKRSRIIVSTGPSGTGKTLLAVEQGIRQFLIRKVDKLIFTRPIVSVDEDLGFLPGGIDEKMAPWIRPIHDILFHFIHPRDVERLMENKDIEISPLAYMRGRTFKNCWIIADEMQNSTISQMKMLLTRVGEGTKLVITGDLDQHDRGLETNGLEDFTNKLLRTRSVSIHSVEFDKNDVERDQVVKEVLDIYGMEEQNYALPEDILSTSPNTMISNLSNDPSESNESESKTEEHNEEHNEE
jgi:phosphate starvation-inducible PhoH-like protein